MGISRDSMHKRRATGGKKKAWRKKRKYELGRQPANTKVSSNKTVRRIRVRGGNVKWTALRLDTGNYSWGSDAVTRKTRILDVVYYCYFVSPSGVHGAGLISEQEKPNLKPSIKNPPQAQSPASVNQSIPSGSHIETLCFAISILKMKIISDASELTCCDWVEADCC
ncbi:hypothetical protein LWI29_026952 [Acer saccharum]|uniref:40S ribosomal protein S8 n=1 Tax=Acer saccharum TaxID=4024 RepID=A0AA39S545_ACESA|nr:hypothetical protein LWI29_026952 [Acer saccharum]